MTQLAGENNRLFTDDLGAEWFQYVGSVIETTRQFCELLTEKEYIHKSEIKDILNGYIEIDGKVHECEMNPKTGLPKGLIEGTTEQNFQVNVGGWNCRHQLIPISELMVPEHIRAKFDKGVNSQIEQAKEQAQQREDDNMLIRTEKEPTVDVDTIETPSFSYTEDNTKLSIEERADNIISGLKALFGSEENVPTFLLGEWDLIKLSYQSIKNNTNLSQNKKNLLLENSVIKRFASISSGGILEQLKSINHLNELAMTNKLNEIPVKWRAEFNQYAKNIRSTDIEKVGYASVYIEIEAAYNIYKLSTSPMAVKYGLDKISSKMPHQFFEEMKSKLKIDITETMPSKEFFDSLN